MAKEQKKDLIIRIFKGKAVGEPVGFLDKQLSDVELKKHIKKYYGSGLFTICWHNGTYPIRKSVLVMGPSNDDSEAVNPHKDSQLEFLKMERENLRHTELIEYIDECMSDISGKLNAVLTLLELQEETEEKSAKISQDKDPIESKLSEKMIDKVLEKLDKF